MKFIDGGSHLLVSWLPEKNTDFYLNALRNVFGKSDINLAYIGAEEWNLKSAGIADPLDISSFSALQTAGFTHLLLVTELSNRSESAYSYYTSMEMSREKNSRGYKTSWNERGNQSEIQLRLLPLSDINAIHTIVAKTTISHLAIRQQDKGESHINVTSVEAARYKAMVKAAKRMLQECGAD